MQSILEHRKPARTCRFTSSPGAAFERSSNPSSSCTDQKTCVCSPRRTRAIANDTCSSEISAMTRIIFRLAPIAILTLGTLAQAADQYPVRAVRIVVATSPGATADVAARLVSQPLAQRFGQQVVVENRAGGATMIGSDIVAKAAPDGYTLLMGGFALTTNPALYSKIPYDALRDFAPISLAITSPSILVVHPSLPVKSVKELIALAKARPGDLAYASQGNGSGPHMFMELLLSLAGARMLHVPYKGPAVAIIDVTAGRVPVMMTGTFNGGPHIRAGRLRALGVTGSTRAASMPGVPTIAESGLPGYEAVQWAGLLAPARVPQEIITRLHHEVAAILNAPDVTERVINNDASVTVNSPAEFAAFMRSESARWAKVARSAGIRPE
jgi:tripartite-type tricarboxylate transporter receptor subunit TctC